MLPYIYNFIHRHAMIAENIGKQQTRKQKCKNDNICSTAETYLQKYCQIYDI